MRFQTTLLAAGKTATGIEIPAEIVEALGAGKRPPVRVTIKGHTYRSTVARRGERYLVGVSAENREHAGVVAGDEIDVEIELDSEPREVPLPADFSEALDGDANAKRFFDELTPTQRGYVVSDIESAKKAETRQRRIENAVGMLREGRKR
jgi:hypothetical protein